MNVGSSSPGKSGEWWEAMRRVGSGCSKWWLRLPRVDAPGGWTSLQPGASACPKIPRFHREPVNEDGGRTMRGILIPVEGDLRVVEYDGLEQLKFHADGWPERVRVFNAHGRLENRVIVIDEEGRRKGKPVNPRASVLYREYLHGEPIVGDAVWCAEWFSDRGEVDYIDLSDEDLATDIEWLNEFTWSLDQCPSYGDGMGQCYGRKVNGACEYHGNVTRHMFDFPNNDGSAPLCHNLLTGGALVRQVISNVNCPACFDLYERARKSPEQCPVCGQADNCGDCNHEGVQA